MEGLLRRKFKFLSLIVIVLLGFTFLLGALYSNSEVIIKYVIWQKNIMKEDRNGVIPCGAVCSYDGTPQPAKFYPYIEKPVNCHNIFTRLVAPPGDSIYPPPSVPPSGQYQAFIQNGESPIQEWLYTNDFKPQVKTPMAVFSRNDINTLLKQDQDGIQINSYDDKGLMKKVLSTMEPYIKDKNGFVVGTERPWLEALILNLKANKVTTLEYRKLLLDHPKLESKYPSDIGKEFLTESNKLFDFGASFSSIEHSGLGRYGDPINPYGDLEAMAQCWCMCKPGGIFFLSVPTSSDNSSYIVWNAHRVYGKKRLQHLTANWIVLHRYNGKDAFKQDVFVLQKPIKH